jgi:hypothetical protein
MSVVPGKAGVAIDGAVPARFYTAGSIGRKRGPSIPLRRSLDRLPLWCRSVTAEVEAHSFENGRDV